MKLDESKLFRVGAFGDELQYHNKPRCTMFIHRAHPTHMGIEEQCARYGAVEPRRRAHRDHLQDQEMVLVRRCS
jgi:hypothetical protein